MLLWVPLAAAGWYIFSCHRSCWPFTQEGCWFLLLALSTKRFSLNLTMFVLYIFLIHHTNLPRCCSVFILISPQQISSMHTGFSLSLSYFPLCLFNLLAILNPYFLFDLLHLCPVFFSHPFLVLYFLVYVFDVSFSITQRCTSWSFPLSFLIFMLRRIIFNIFLCCSISFHLPSNVRNSCNLTECFIYCFSVHWFTLYPVVVGLKKEALLWHKQNFITLYYFIPLLPFKLKFVSVYLWSHCLHM